MIQECQELELEYAPGTPKKYSRRLKPLSLGMPPVHPLLINNYQFVILFTIFLLLHMLCACLERLALYFSVLFCLFQFFAGHNNLDPIMPCLGEKHTPLLPRMLIVFTSIFVECSFLFSSCYHVQLLFFMFIFKSYCLGYCFQYSLKFHAYLVQRVGLLH